MVAKVTHEADEDAAPEGGTMGLDMLTSGDHPKAKADDEVEAIILAQIARIDLQGRELGRFQERVEGLLRSKSQQNEEMQVLKMTNAQILADNALAIRTMTQAIVKEKEMNERAERYHEENVRLRKLVAGGAP